MLPLSVFSDIKCRSCSRRFLDGVDFTFSGVLPLSYLKSSWNMGKNFTELHNRVNMV